MTSTPQNQTQADKAFPYPFPPSWASEWGEDINGLWASFFYKNTEQTFRWIPAGIFLMGSPQEEEGRFSDEDLHQVTLSEGFWLADTTVTQAFWQLVMSENPSHFSDNLQNPVERVSWDDTTQFIEKLNKINTELNARLPYEAEWEYACRAGTSTAFNLSGELTVEQVNYRGTWKWESADVWGKDARQATVAVKSMKNSNAWGLHEMHGNVWEWCQDYWQENLGKQAVIDPKGKKEGARRVVRGGSWLGSGGDVRSAVRGHGLPGYRVSAAGFRLALGHASKGVGHQAGRTVTKAEP